VLQACITDPQNLSKIITDFTDKKKSSDERSENLKRKIYELVVRNICWSYLRISGKCEYIIRRDVRELYLINFATS
jgi:hypothetical protein